MINKIKTWWDVEKSNPEYFIHSNAPSPTLIPSQELRYKLLNKTIATYKIVTIIELGYGGMITNKEWENDSIMKYNIENIGNNLTFVDDTDHYSFISFRTDELREEFMSYEENVKLVKQYFMI